uniref:Ig-like domain-containing protein n=1 Tax=Stegastes partitus TaxID=144197 RepID=A0A3B4ZZ32_9TELE
MQFDELEIKAALSVILVTTVHSLDSLSLFLSGKAQLSDISQPSFQAVKLGDTVTISCFMSKFERTRVWYKLTTERKLQFVASIDAMFEDQKIKKQFQHFSTNFNHTSSHLIIPKTVREDAGTYYCGVLHPEETMFGQGTFLMINGAKMISDSVVQKPESCSVQSGDSVALTCSVKSRHCATEHISVTWLKNSHHSAPEMTYSPGHQECRTDSGGATCVFDFLMKNLSSEDAGLYYCVVTSCGQIQLGNGTRVQVNDAALNKSLDLSPGVIALIISNVIFGVVTLLLVWTLCKNRKKEPEDPVIYAAVTSVARISSCRPAPVKCNEDMVVYSDEQRDIVIKQTYT